MRDNGSSCAGSGGVGYGAETTIHYALGLLLSAHGIEVLRYLAGPMLLVMHHKTISQGWHSTLSQYIEGLALKDVLPWEEPSIGPKFLDGLPPEFLSFWQYLFCPYLLGMRCDSS